MGDWFDFTGLQWGLLVFSFVTCAVTAEITLRKLKQEQAAEILDSVRAGGAGADEIAAWEQHLKKCSPIDVMVLHNQLKN